MWQGWYEQDNAQHPVKFADFKAVPAPGALVSGNGTDEVGNFTFEGTFNQEVTKVRFKKQYTTGTKHAVYY